MHEDMDYEYAFTISRHVTLWMGETVGKNSFRLAY